MKKVKKKQREKWTNVLTFPRLFPFSVILFWSFLFIRAERHHHHCLKSMLHLFDGLNRSISWKRKKTNIGLYVRSWIGTWVSWKTSGSKLFCMRMNFAHSMRIFALLSSRIHFSLSIITLISIKRVFVRVGSDFYNGVVIDISMHRILYS